jgi:hypothetical protein
MEPITKPSVKLFYVTSMVEGNNCKSHGSRLVEGRRNTTVNLSEAYC